MIVIAIKFINAIMHIKIDIVFYLKFNILSAKNTKSGYHKSAGLIIVHNKSILLVIIRFISHNIN